MSVDERLLRALHAHADTVDPEVEAALAGVRSRGRTVRRARTAAVAGCVAASVAALAGAVVWMGSTEEEPGPPAGDPTRSPVATSGPTVSAPLRGELVGEVVAPTPLAGTWTLRLDGNGTLGVQPPPALADGVADALFTADAVTFRTTLFQDGDCAQQGTGIYRWLAVGDRIEFEVVSDPCATRTAFLEESTWSVSTSTGARG